MLWLARRLLLARSLAVLPHKIPQSLRIGLRPDRATLKAGVARWVKIRAVAHGDGEKAESIWSEHDV